jgi:hypothetical protein
MISQKESLKILRDSVRENLGDSNEPILGRIRVVNGGKIVFSFI